MQHDRQPLAGPPAMPSHMQLHEVCLLCCLSTHCSSACLLPGVEEEVLAVQQASVAVLKESATVAEWIQYMQVRAES